MTLGRLCLFIAVIMCCVNTTWATQDSDPNLTDLKDEIRQMQQKIHVLEARLDETSATEEDTEEDEAALLRQMAEEMAGDKTERAKPEETTFKSAGLSLQKLNPEISVAADLLTHYTDQDNVRKKSETDLRGVELSFQSYLDPYSRMKAVFHVHDGNVETEEAYMTLFSTFEGVNVDLGKFRQQFGVVNRWHEDALDQVNYPLPVQNILGEEGLAQTGASFETTLPQWGSAHQGLTLQITTAENEHLFEQEAQGLPALLFHYKNYRDLTESTYLEFGLSGLFGWNDTWDVKPGPTVANQYDALGTQVYGVDLSILWEPLDQALYRSVEWRSELYILNQDILAPDGSGRDTLGCWGFYSYVQSKINRSAAVGIRGDYYKADSKPYANTPNASLAPLAYTSKRAYRWQVVPYLTWWQSEFVKFRGEYNFADGRGMDPKAHTVWLQAIFAAGPHKHERY